MALTVVLVVIATLGAMQQVGLPKLAANRENMPEMPGWAGRAERAHRNMLESLVLFAVLVLVARALNISTDTTVLGAQLFFWAASPMPRSTSPASPGYGRRPGWCRSWGCC